MLKKTFLLCLALCAVTAFAQKNVVDEVVWVVGDAPILLSDIEETRISQEMNGEAVSNPYCTIPEQLAIQKLFIHQAEIDSVEVSEGDVARFADQRINYFIQNFGSRENVEAMSHKTIAQLREEFKEQARNDQLMNGVKQSLIRSTKVTPAEVREYYKHVPEDSIPYIPTMVEVQIITSQPKISREEVERVEGQLRDYAQRVNSGESSFSTLALLYSQDPGSARRGGELGFMGKGELVDEFANVAFALNDTKKVSKIVHSEFGYHIIQLIEKRGDKINCRHILLKPEVEESEITRCLGRLDSIAGDIRDGKFTFDAAAFRLSDDKDTRNNNGLLVNQQGYNITSRFEMKDLPQDVAKMVSTMQVGEVSRAFRMVSDKTGQEVCAIVKLKNRIDGHRATMADDYQTLMEEVLFVRNKEKIDEWIKQKIKTTHVIVNPDWRNCDFQYEGWVK
ncbi:MAG: peptidylprolyl isomerase [Bacteroidales bacterium]|nr:peptidylprolyl isomerase [Candidatus Equimonas enterica]